MYSKNLKLFHHLHEGIVLCGVLEHSVTFLDIAHSNCDIIIEVSDICGSGSCEH